MFFIRKNSKKMSIYEVKESSKTVKSLKTRQSRDIVRPHKTP